MFFILSILLFSPSLPTLRGRGISPTPSLCYSFANLHKFFKTTNIFHSIFYKKELLVPAKNGLDPDGVAYLITKPWLEEAGALRK